MQLTFLHNALTGLGFGLITDIKTDLGAAGKSASGDLIQGTGFRVEQNSEFMSMHAFVSGPASKYYKIIDGGRKPGTYPPITDIRKWIDTKGIVPEGKTTKDQLAFLFARKIKRDGIEPTNIFTDNIEKFNTDVLARAFGQDFKAEIKSIAQAFR